MTTTLGRHQRTGLCWIDAEADHHVVGDGVCRGRREAHIQLGIAADFRLGGNGIHHNADGLLDSGLAAVGIGKFGQLDVDVF